MQTRAPTVQSCAADRATDANRIRVLIVDDHPILREGIVAVLSHLVDIQVVGEASNGREAVELYSKLLPDVTLMDLQMPEVDGMEALNAIKRLCPAAKVVVLTTYSGDVQAMKALKAGANGYLLKSMLRRELADTIRAVADGKRRIPLEIAAALAEHAADEDLTPRELEVLKEVAQGHANKAVAARLGIADETVKAHMKGIMAKLGARDRTHAVTIALRRGMIDL